MRYLEYENWIPGFLATFQEKEAHLSYTQLAKNNDIICLQEIQGKDEFLQAIHVLVPQSWLFGTLVPNNVSGGGSAFCIHKNLLPDEQLLLT